jgi:drug/metabolite transporter (DMT)-like permease
VLTPVVFVYGGGHDAVGWALLIGIGVVGGIGQIALTASLRWAPVSVVIGMDYIAILWATLGGWLVWGALPGPATWTGGTIIIASGLYIAWREHRLSIQRIRETIT